MNPIISALLALLPPRRKTTPSGWISFDAVCCTYQGETKDTKKRGGILINPDTGFQYHCFNCQFKAGWSQGKLLSSNTKKLFNYLGMNQEDVTKLGLYALSTKEELPQQIKQHNYDLAEKTLPESTMSIETWLEADPPDDIMDYLTKVIDYITVERGMAWSWYPWHWSASPGYQDRVIIPFYDRQRIVGYTARKITDGKPKYITDSQSGYVFNLDNQPHDRTKLIVVEGQFDAIAIDGAAIMTNEPNDVQVTRIQAQNKQVIVVPDRDRAGRKMIKSAVKNSWSVSFPQWEADIKDVADAVKRYGRLYTLVSILHYAESNPIKIQLLEKIHYGHYEKN